MKKNIFNLLGLSVVLIIVLAGCGPTAHIERAANVNFNKYKTFAWAQKDQRGTRTDLTEQRVKDAIGMQLERSVGWRESSTHPDVILSYDLLVEKGSRLQSDPVYTWSGFRTFYNPYTRRFYNVYYPSRFMGYDNYQVPTREGTIAITMVDTRTDKTILQGWATDEVGSNRLSFKEVDRIVNSIFKKFDSYNKSDRLYEEGYGRASRR